MKKPSLPKSLDAMNEVEQAQAQEQYRRRHLHFYYFAATYRFNRLNYDALLVDSILSIQKLQQFASAPWEGDNITLKAELIRAVQNWSWLTVGKNGVVPPCPINFSDKEVEECLRLEAGQDYLDVQMEKK